MRGSHLFAALTAAVVGLALCPSAYGAGATKDEIEDIAAQLRRNAERWWNDQEPDVRVELALKDIWFDANAVPHLVDVLRKTPADANGLYVANRLLRQLTFARADAIRIALPSVKAVHQNVKGNYKPFYRLTESQIEALQKPTSDSRVAQEALQQRRRKKVEAERAIAKHNQMINILERTTFKLMMLARRTTEDKALVEALIEAEKDRSANFLMILDLFASEARRMFTIPERAKLIYSLLRPYAIEVKMQKRTSYLDRGRAVIREDDESRYETVNTYPSIRMLRVLNRIATAGKDPALKVPAEKDIEKYHRDREKKASQNPKDRKGRG